MKALEVRGTCPDCGVKVGETHQPGCDIERCPFCGEQMLQDECQYEYFGINVATMEEKHPDIYEHGLPDELAEKYEEYLRPHFLKWDGVWPGVRECREYNLWSKWTDHGWEKCDADDPEASEDLNELAIRSHWDKEAKKYVLSPPKCRQCGKDDLPLNQQSGLCVRCTIDNEMALQANGTNEE